MLDFHLAKRAFVLFLVFVIGAFPAIQEVDEVCFSSGFPSQSLSFLAAEDLREVPPVSTGQICLERYMLVGTPE